jgi:SAM-dependent methyltransferase
MMDEDYARNYRELWERHWWWRARREVVLEEIRRIGLTPGGQILDVGCGPGLFFEHLRQFGRVEGVESDSVLADASPWPEHIRVGPFDAPMDLAQSYALILMLDVLEHMDDPRTALEQAATHLKPGGALLITVPAFESLWTNHDVINCHRRRYRKREVEGLISEAGLELESCRYFFHWTVLAKLMVRLFEEISRPEPRPPRTPPQPVNRALYLLSRVEQSLLGSVRIPLGTSILAVARRV